MSEPIAKCERCGNRLGTEGGRLCDACAGQQRDEVAEGDVYDFANEPAPVAAPRRMSSPPAPVKLEYRAVAPKSSKAVEPDTIKNLYMPLWLLGGGVAIQVAMTFFKEREIERALIVVGVQLVLGTAVMLGGILLAARLRGIDLGRFWTTVFKLSAISVAPGALVVLVSPVLHLLPLGGLLGWVAEFILYFAMLGALFDLDESDTWYCVFVIFLVRVGLYFALMWVLR
jgi:hypothetical protein